MVATQQHTARDLWNLQDDLEDFELIEGILVPVSPPGGIHAIAQVRIASLLLQHVERRQCGEVFGEVGFILATDPDTVLAPDIAFVESTRLPEDLHGFLALAPDLAVEIVSPSNSPGKIERKIAIYLQTGTRLVWVVHPHQRQVVAHSPDESPRVFVKSDDLPGGDVLPGLAIPVSRIFR